MKKLFSISTFTVTKFIVMTICLIVLAVAFVGIRVMYEKKVFADRLRELNKQGNWIANKSDGFYAGTNKIKYLTEIERRGADYGYYAKFENEKASPVIIAKYDFSQLHEQILITSYMFSDIHYLKRQTKIERYYDPGEIVYDSYGLARMVNYGWKERIVYEPDESPNEIYQNCLAYYIKELKLDITKETDLIDVFGLIRGLRYHGLQTISVAGESIWAEERNIGNEYVSIKVYENSARWGKSFNKNNVVDDMVSCSLLLFLIPIILLCFSYWKKNPQKIIKILIWWILINYIFLVISSSGWIFNNRYIHYFNDKSVYTVESYKTVWPFNSSIIRKDYKEVYLGENKTTYSPEKEIKTVKLLDGYDFTEFIAYSLLGYIAVRLIRKKINTKKTITT